MYICDIMMYTVTIQHTANIESSEVWGTFTAGRKCIKPLSIQYLHPAQPDTHRTVLPRSNVFKPINIRFRERFLDNSIVGNNVTKRKQQRSRIDNNLFVFLLSSDHGRTVAVTYILYKPSYSQNKVLKINRDFWTCDLKKWNHKKSS